MDSLALLCTLHADGPATLRRLRKAGCQSLADMERVGADGIAELLSIPPAVARRLVRESRILNERVGGDPLDTEEAPEGMAVAPLGNAQAPLTESSDLDDKDRDLIRQVLGDARPVGGFRSEQPAIEVPEPVEVEPLGGAFSFEGNAQVEPVETERESRGQQHILLGRVDGLDEKVAASLSDAGIETLTGLVEADASKLARATGLAFGPLRRLQFLARKSLQAGGEVSIPVPAAEKHVLPTLSDAMPEADGTVASFILPRPAQFTGLQAHVEPEPEAAPEIVSPMAPSPVAEDPFAKETWPEAKMPQIKALEPEAAGPMADELPKTPAPQPLGRWMPRGMREAQAHTEECKEPEPVLVPPPPPRRFWEPKRFWEARKNKRMAAAESVGAEGLKETENLQGGNLPPAPAPVDSVGGGEVPSTQVPMPSAKDLGDLRWDFREPQFRPESGGKGGFQFEEPGGQEPEGDSSGPFA